MTLNASARTYRVWVNLPNESAETGLEVTQYCSGDSGGFLTVTINPFDESGIFSITGQLTLDTPPYDVLFDRWESPARWAVGNWIYIKVSDESGSLREFPVNHLYIVSIIKDPDPKSWTFEIELGDIFALNSTKEPTQIPVINRTRRSALDLMLGQIDATMIGEVYGTDSAFFTFSTKETIVSQVGQLALGGFSGLYQDKDSNIRPIRLNFTPEWRLFLHHVGSDDAGEFEKIANAARADDEINTTVEELEKEAIETNRYRGVDFYVTEMAESAIDLASNNATEINAIEGVRRWNWVTSYRFTETVDEQARRGLVVPESLYEALIAQGRSINYPGPLAMINSMNSEEVKIYEGSSEGRLLSHTKTVYKTIGEILAEFYKKNLLPSSSIPPFLSKIVAEETEITYSYRKSEQGNADSKGQVRKIRTTKRMPLGLIAAAANDWIGQGIGGPVLTADPADLIVAEVRVQTWRKRSSDEWETTDETWKAGQVRSGGIKAFRQLIKINDPDGNTRHSRTGEIQPPPAERRPAKEELNRPSNTLRSTSIVSAKLNRAIRRKRNLQIKNLSKTGASTVTELLIKLDGYREQGWRITTTLRDEWFWFKPFARIDLAYNNRVYYGIADVIVFAFAANQTAVTVDCMKVGRSTFTSSTDTYPYLPLPDLVTEPNPDPFGTIPIGQGSFPDPVPPAEDDATPEINFQEPIIPTVEVVTPIVALSDSVMTFNEVAYSVAPSPPIEVIALSDSVGDFEIVVDPPVGGLVGEWLLDTSSWSDSVGSNDLVEVGLGANLVLDSSLSANVAEFGGSGYDPTIDYLEVTDSAFSTRTASANWSWKITFDYWIDADVSGFSTGGAYLIRLVNQWEITFEFGVPFIQILDGYQVAALFLTNLDFPPAQGEWHSLIFEYNATTTELTGSIDGVPDLYTSTCPVLSNVTPGALQIGYKAPSPTRIRNVRYYLIDLVDNP